MPSLYYSYLEIRVIFPSTETNFSRLSFLSVKINIYEWDLHNGNLREKKSFAESGSVGFGKDCLQQASAL
jgi:hypothetical protein